jgi:beta-galactosidase
MNGANIDGKYAPTVTSYDYDVPIAEDGTLREKFFLFRDAIQSVTGVKPPEPPTAMEVRALEPAKLDAAAPLMENLPRAIESATTLTMEQVEQNYGYILYRTTLKKGGELKLDELHSYARVYVDGKLAGTLDRRLGESTLKIAAGKDAQLDILVENSGRVNFGPHFPTDAAGITKRATLDGEELRGWKIFSLPMDNVSALSYTAKSCEGACFARGFFTVEKPVDSFVDMRGFSKGMVFINGQPLGRFWHIGPQQTLYLPAPWLKAGRNEIVVFDLDSKAGQSVKFTDKPVLDEAH